MIELLLKSSFAIGLALVFYKLVLQKESFFATNRFYLVGCIILAFALPYISLPKLIEQQGIVEKLFEEPELLQVETKTSSSNSQIPVTDYQPATTIYLENQKTEPVIPLPITSKPQSQQGQDTEPAVAEPVTYDLSWQDLVKWLYLFGVGIFSISLLYQLGMLIYEIFTAREKIRDGQYVIVNTRTRKAPCSFFNYIFIYPDDYDFETYEQIITHEKTHVRLRHSYDLLLAELAVIVLWFNPLIWLFKREIEKNNEFQTDAKLIERHNVRKDQYQLNLLQIAVPNKPLNITTNYNQSLIKQRIVMMNSKRSTPLAYWKYSFLLPFFFGILLLLNEPALAQVTQETATDKTEDPQSTNAQEQESEEERTLANQDRQNLREHRSQVVRERQNLRKLNNQVRIERRNLNNRTEVAVRSRERIQERRALVQERRENMRNSSAQRSVIRGHRIVSLAGRTAQIDITKGTWYSSIKNGQYCLEFRGGDENTRWNMSDCFKTSAFQKKSADTYIMTNEVGTLELKGNLEEEVSQGKYTFTENSDFRSFIQENNISEVNSSTMFHLFFNGLSRDYVKFLKKEYPDLDGEDLVAVAVHEVKQEDFQKMVSLFKNHSKANPEIEDIIGLKIHGVDEAYVAELQKMGFTDLSLDDIMAAKIHGISTAYFQQLQEAGFTDLSMDEIVAAKIHGIAPQTIQDMKALGAHDLDRIIELTIHGVGADYVKELQNAGLEDLSLDEIVAAKIHGLSASSIKEMRDMGIEGMDFDDMVSAQIHGVDPQFIRGLEAAGFSNLEMDEIVSAKIHGTDGEFIKDARKKGYNLKSIDKYIELKIHGNAMEDLKAEE